LLIADGVLTVLNVTSTAHPFAFESMLVPSFILERAGVVGLLLVKLAQAGLVIAAIDYLRHRGYRLAPFFLGFVAIAAYSLVDAAGLALLLSPPTDPALIKFILDNGLLNP
jgi:hypothetical protein